MHDHELQTLHGLQSALEGLARLDEGAEILIIGGLDGEGGVVGRWVKEGGFGEVEKDYLIFIYIHF